MGFTVLVVIWAALAVFVAGLAAYRMVISWREDDRIRLNDGEMAELAQQRELGNKIDWTERWGPRLTVVAVVYGIVLACVYLYKVLVETEVATKMS